MAEQQQAAAIETGLEIQAETFDEFKKSSLQLYVIPSLSLALSCICAPEELYF